LTRAGNLEEVPDMAAVLKASAIVMLALCFAAGPAEAYLDPGSGSMIVQGILATIAACGAYFGMHWRKFRDFLDRRSAGSDKTKP
jgi:hypothetical protein